MNPSPPPDRNGIPVPDFIGEPDEILGRVLNLLHELEPMEDVREHLDDMFQLQEHLAEASEELLGPQWREKQGGPE